MSHKVAAIKAERERLARVRRQREITREHAEYNALKASFERKWGVDPLSRVADFFLPLFGQEAAEAFAALAEVHAAHRRVVRLAA